MGIGVLNYALVFLLLIGIADAATIHGAVYDLSLKRVNNARVEINTSPKQFLIAQNGSYSFNIPNGNYIIKAQLIQINTVIASVQENISIKQTGDYVLDLILFPDVEEGIGDIDIDVNEGIIEAKKNTTLIWFLVFVILAAAVVLFFYFTKIKKQKKETSEIKSEQKEEQYEDTDLQQLIKIIKQEGGRTTQKDIRKQMPLSEAKISLMIAELEHKGIIEKIKKGRGNIIILKRK